VCNVHGCHREGAGRKELHQKIGIHLDKVAGRGISMRIGTKSQVRWSILIFHVAIPSA
jgi:hypothetical protein